MVRDSLVDGEDLWISEGGLPLRGSWRPKSTLQVGPVAFHWIDGFGFQPTTVIGPCTAALAFGMVGGVPYMAGCGEGVNEAALWSWTADQWQLRATAALAAGIDLSLGVNRTAVGQLASTDLGVAVALDGHLLVQCGHSLHPVNVDGAAWPLALHGGVFCFVAGVPCWVGETLVPVYGRTPYVGAKAAGKYDGGVWAVVNSVVGAVTYSDLYRFDGVDSAQRVARMSGHPYWNLIALGNRLVLLGSGIYIPGIVGEYSADPGLFLRVYDGDTLSAETQMPGDWFGLTSHGGAMASGVMGVSYEWVLTTEPGPSEYLAQPQALFAITDQLGLLGIELDWGTEAQGRPAGSSVAVEWGAGAGTDRPAAQALTLEWKDTSAGTSPTAQDVTVEWQAAWYEAELQPRVDDVTLEYAGSDEAGVSPEMETVGLEWAQTFAPAGGDLVRWVLDTDMARKAVGVNVSTTFPITTESDVRALVRCDLEALPADNWASYQPVELNTNTVIAAPGYVVRVAIIIPAGTDPADISVQLKREEP
jgi:hypothetical protein